MSKESATHRAECREAFGASQALFCLALQRRVSAGAWPGGWLRRRPCPAAVASLLCERAPPLTTFTACSFRRARLCQRANTIGTGRILAWRRVVGACWSMGEPRRAHVACFSCAKWPTRKACAPFGIRQRHFKSRCTPRLLSKGCTVHTARLNGLFVRACNLKGLTTDF